MLRLYLVRHGQTAWNHTGRIQGHSDVPLDEIGQQQAQRVASWLGERVHAPLAIYTSDLKRCLQTAETIATRLNAPIHPTTALRERHWGAWEGLTREEVIERYPEHHFTYLYDPLAGTPPEGEPMNAFWDRVQQFASQLYAQHPEGELVVVGHGGSLRILLCDALAGDIQTYRRIRLDNTAVSIIERVDGRIWVALLNYTGFLDSK
ncbi:Phosphoserine phosphatase 1 [bacterium HR15]|nr:Phosphoserine phosphatase 1 [bacterium HR15]